jgi:hypothetical protein
MIQRSLLVSLLLISSIVSYCQDTDSLSGVTDILIKNVTYGGGCDSDSPDSLYATFDIDFYLSDTLNTGKVEFLLLIKTVREGEQIKITKLFNLELIQSQLAKRNHKSLGSTVVNITNEDIAEMPADNDFLDFVAIMPNYPEVRSNTVQTNCKTKQTKNIITAGVSFSDDVSIDLGLTLSGDPQLLTYSATILSENESEDITNIKILPQLDPKVEYISNTIQISPIGVNDVVRAYADYSVWIPFKALYKNDYAGSGNEVHIKEFMGDRSTEKGGIISYNYDFGSYKYTPPAGFRGQDAFSYYVRNDKGNEELTPTELLFDVIFRDIMIWHIDNTAEPGGDGSEEHPFASIDEFMDTQIIFGQPGDYIYIHEGTGLYEGYLELLDEQIVYGPGSDFVIDDILMRPAQSVIPQLSNPNGSSLGLAKDNEVWGLNFGNSLSFAIEGEYFGTFKAVEINVDNKIGGIFSLGHGNVDMNFGKVFSSLGDFGMYGNNLSGRITFKYEANIENAFNHALAFANCSNLEITFDDLLDVLNNDDLYSDNAELFISDMIDCLINFNNLQINTLRGGLQSLDLQESFFNIDQFSISTGYKGLDLEGPGTYNMSGLNTLSSGKGAALSLNDVNTGSNFNFSILESLNSLEEAIRLTNSSVNLNIDLGSIINPAYSAFYMNGGHSTVTYNGTMLSTMAPMYPMFDISDTDDGSSTFTGGPYRDENGGGANLYHIASDFTLGNYQSINSSSYGFASFGGSGEVSLSNIGIEYSSEEGVAVTGGTKNITLQNIDIKTNGSTGLLINNTGLVSATGTNKINSLNATAFGGNNFQVGEKGISFSELIAEGTFGVGINLQYVLGGLISILDGRIDGPALYCIYLLDVANFMIQSMELTNSAGWGISSEMMGMADYNLSVLESSFSSMTDGYGVYTSVGGDNTFHFTLEGSMFDMIGLPVGVGLTENGSTSATITENDFQNNAFGGVSFFSDGATGEGSLDLIASGNNIGTEDQTGSGVESGFGLSIVTDNLKSIYATITGNNIYDCSEGGIVFSPTHSGENVIAEINNNLCISTGVPGLWVYSANVLAATCLQILNNALGIISIENITGVMTIVDLLNLSLLNFNAVVNLNPVEPINDTESCPL